MSTLNLQPPRVPLTEPKTGMITREWYRYITDSFKRQGGGSALTNSELEELASEPAANSDSSAVQVFDISSRLDELQLAIGGLAVQLDSASALRQRIDELEQSHASFDSMVSEIVMLKQRCNDLEQLASQQDIFRVDWERPGKIGSLTANTVRGTTVESTIVTGTAPFTVASTTKVSNLNVDQLDGADWAAPAAIGSTTPNAGTFTVLRGNSLAKVVADSPTAQSVSTATFTDITNWTERLDTGNDFNPTTGVFTAPRAGQYLVSGMVDFASVAWAAVNRQATLGLYKNGSAVCFTRTTSQAAATMALPTGYLAVLVDLAASDTLKFTVYQDSGSSVNTVSSTTTRFMIAELP